jgi:hypothetical protein
MRRARAQEIRRALVAPYRWHDGHPPLCLGADARTSIQSDKPPIGASIAPNLRDDGQPPFSTEPSLIKVSCPSAISEKSPRHVLDSRAAFSAGSISGTLGVEN